MVRTRAEKLKKILIGCYEVPGYGGASTSAYKLFEKMQTDGLEVYFINLIEKRDADYFRYNLGKQFGNPKGLDRVQNCIFEGQLFGPHQRLAKVVAEISPDLTEMRHA